MTRFEEIKNMTKPDELGEFLCDLVEDCAECPPEISKRCNPYTSGEWRGFTKYLEEESEC